MVLSTVLSWAGRRTMAKDQDIDIAAV